ncbi:MAG: nickel pincer cofactor biosynthesis protein LarC [Armatimonadetes bacterium]|nr:nickel pincer cofactor biosynthesis protein LarC [Armatimonadota bacterium]
MNRIAYFDCPSGVAGNMVLGALLHCGADADRLRDRLAALDLGEWSLHIEDRSVNGVGATHVDIVTAEEHGHGRHLSHIEDLIEGGGLPRDVQVSSINVFRRLAQAEAAVHGVDVESLHFHEVGAVDAIVDIVGSCLLLHDLGVGRVVCSPLPVGHGYVRCMHGTIPIPAPAVVELTLGTPTYGVDVEAELVTPTGAALMTALAEQFGPQPTMAAECAGYGCGTRELPDRPNMLRVLIGTPSPSGTDEVAVVETNIDDLSPQMYELTMERLFAAGALDVFTSPIQMKKNRPATLLTVLCSPDLVDAMAALLFAETTTLGVRVSQQRRMCMARDVVSVDTDFGAIRVKVASWGDRVRKPAPEYDDVKAAAVRSGAPAILVAEAALAAYRRMQED